MRQNDTFPFAAPMAPGSESFRSYRANETNFGSRGDRSARSSRFVTQSHALGTPMANPASLILAAAIAVAVYLIGRRLVD